MMVFTTGTSLSAELRLGTGCLTGDLTGDLTGWDLTEELTGDLLLAFTGDERVSVGSIAGVALYMNVVSCSLDIWLRSRLTSPCSTCIQSIDLPLVFLGLTHGSQQTMAGETTCTEH